MSVDQFIAVPSAISSFLAHFALIITSQNDSQLEVGVARVIAGIEELVDTAVFCSTVDI